MFHYVLFNECLSFGFGHFIFYSKIALWPISHTAKMFVAKMFAVQMLAAKMLMVKMPHAGSGCILLRKVMSLIGWPLSHNTATAMTLPLLVTSPSLAHFRSRGDNNFLMLIAPSASTSSVGFLNLL